MTGYMNTNLVEGSSLRWCQKYSLDATYGDITVAIYFALI